MFRFKKSIDVSYNRQGLIYFVSRCYADMPAEIKRTIEGMCMIAGGEYYQALFAFVTTDAGAAEICMKYFLSESTLERIVRKYYVEFSGIL